MSNRESIRIRWRLTKRQCTQVAMVTMNQLAQYEMGEDVTTRGGRVDEGARARLDALYNGLSVTSDAISAVR